MIFGDPDMELGFGEVRNVARQGAGVLVQAFAHQNPSHVGPPLAIERCVRIAFLIGELMMNAVSRDPENRSTFKGKSCTDGQEIFHPLRSFVSAMSEQAVVPHADAKAAGNPPEKTCDQECLP